MSIKINIISFSEIWISHKIFGKILDKNKKANYQNIITNNKIDKGNKIKKKIDNFKKKILYIFNNWK